MNEIKSLKQCADYKTHCIDSNPQQFDKTQCIDNELQHVFIWQVDGVKISTTKLNGNLPIEMNGSCLNRMTHQWNLNGLWHTTKWNGNLPMK